MNIAATNLIEEPRSAIDHHAAALANVTQLVADNHDLQDKCAQLGADNHQLKVRVEMITADRDRLQSESNLFRTKLIELATHQANIGLMTVAAQGIVMTVNDLLEPPKAGTKALDLLEEHFNNGNQAEAK